MVPFVDETLSGMQKSDLAKRSLVQAWFIYSSSTGLSCLVYILYSSDVERSILPCSISLRVTVRRGLGRPMDSRNLTA